MSRSAARFPTGSVARRSRATRLALSGVLVVLVALGHLAVVATVPIAGGPRAPLEGAGPPDRWSPPRPHSDARFATFPTRGPGGEPGLWVPPSTRVPIRFAVEQEVVDRFGLEELRAAVEVWNHVPGSRFGAVIDRVVDTGLDERFRDGVNRIFLDRRSCGGRYLARAHMWPGELVIRDGYAARYVAEFDLGLCDRLRPEQLDIVLRHELLHMAGLDHLCDPDEACHRPGMDDDSTCRIMSTTAHPCQAPTDGDEDGLVHLHPRLPRTSGTDGPSTAAAVVLATHPVPRSVLSVVLTTVDAPLDLQAQAAGLAGQLEVPHLLVDEDCTTGPDGDALDRVLAVAGRAILVGEVTQGCQATLEGAWAVTTERLRSGPDVTARMIEARSDAPPEHIVVVPAAVADDVTPISAVAAAAAVALGAPLVVLDDDGGPGRVLDVVADAPSIRQAVLVADVDLVDPRTAAAIAEAGVEVRRLPAADAADAVVALAGIAEVAPASGLAVAIAAIGRPAHAIPAIGIAAGSGGLLVPIHPELREDHAALLRDRVTRGAIVGDHQAINNERQATLSRLVDGVG